MSDGPPVKDPCTLFQTANTARERLALELRPKYGSLLDTFADICTAYASAPIEIKAAAQKERMKNIRQSAGQPKYSLSIISTAPCESGNLVAEWCCWKVSGGFQNPESKEP